MISAEQMYRNVAAVHLPIGFKGMLKMKRAISLLTLCAVLACCCGCDPYTNRQPWHYEHSVWVCENPHIIYTVGDGAKLLTDDNEFSFDITFRANLADAWKYLKNGDEVTDTKLLFTGVCKYSKTKFIIKVDTETDNLFDGQYDELVFVRQEDEQAD